MSVNNNLAQLRNTTGSTISLGTLNIGAGATVDIWDTVNYDTSIADNFRQVIVGIAVFNEKVDNGDLVYVLNTVDQLPAAAFTSFSKFYEAFQAEDALEGEFGVLKFTGNSVTGLTGRLTDPQIVTVRKNTGANIGARQRLNFIEGTNVGISISDDGVNEEIDITITASGGSGGGDVTGPASATDNAITRFDGTSGKIIKNSGVVIDNSNNITGVNNLNVGGNITITGTVDGVDISTLSGVLDGYALQTTTITAGSGLTGGGDLSTNRTINIGANADGSIIVNADDIQVGILATDTQHGNRGGGTLHANATISTAGFMSANDKAKIDAIVLDGYVPTTRTLTAGAGLTGGGDLSSNRTFDVVANADGSIIVNANDIQVGVINDTQHGNRGGGSLHSNATTSVAGFMSASDKTKLDGVAIGATNTPLSSSTPQAISTTGAAGSGSSASRDDHVHAISFTTVNSVLGTANASINVNNQKIVSLLDPTSAQDAATKNYIDTTPSIAANWKQAVKVATTANITLSGTQTIDGVSVIAADRVLVKNQSTQTENGIYVCAAGSWTRSTDATTASQIQDFVVAVQQGTANADSVWKCITDPTITVGSTNIVISLLGTSAGTPVDVTKASASAGTSSYFAKLDHKHDITTAAPGNIGTSNIEGSATTLARSDHTHALTFTTLNSVIATANASISVNSQKITNLLDPTAAQDAATKTYVDSAISGSSNWKTAVKAATIANITLSGTQTIDGISIVATDRVLVKNQSTQTENGVYVCAAGAWSRATDVATAAQILDMVVTVQQGTVNADTVWKCTNDPTITIGSTNIIFASLGVSTGTPADVTKASASAGTSPNYARLDHKHDITTAAPGNIGTSNTEGSATTLARSDHTHALTFSTLNTVIGTANASIGVNSQKIVSLLDPTAAQDAATKNYVDTTPSIASNWKQVVKAATTANITLSGTQTIDGISIVATDRVLVKNQSTQTENGIYVCAAGAWSRSTDATSASQIQDLVVAVQQGTINADSVWKCTTDPTITVGSTNIVFSPLNVSSTTPSDVTKASASAGTSPNYARIDHKHDITTASAVSLTVGGSNAEGSATTVARSDHTHSLPAFGSSAGTFTEGNDARLSNDRTASGLRTATTVVAISSATAPSSGQALVATSSTAATWQSVALSSITLTAGNGLTGGGDLTANRTFNVGANADGSITVNADDIQVGILATDTQHGNRGGGSLHSAVSNSAAGFVPTVGSSGTILNSTGTAAQWSTSSSLNLVTGPGSATDTAIVRFGGTTGKIVQNSGILIDGSNNITGVTTESFGSTPATAGTLRLPTAGSLQFRNAGNTADVIGISNPSTDVIRVGLGTGTGAASAVQVAASTMVDTVIGSSTIVTVNSTGVDITGALTVSSSITAASATISGNITVSGTVDGVDVSSHASRHNDGGADEISLTGLSGEAADPQKVTVRKNTGSNIGSRSRLNFIEGSNITLTIADDAGSNEVDITIASTGGGGGGTGSLAQTLAVGNTTDGYDVIFTGSSRRIITNNQGTLNTAGDSFTIQTGTGNGTGAGGAVIVTGGQGGTTGAGGAITLTSGAGGSTSGIGGAFTIVAGAATAATAAGGAISITSGAGGSTSGGSGTVTVSSGNTVGTASGSVTIKSGTSSGSTTGFVSIQSGNTLGLAIDANTNFTSATDRQVLSKSTSTSSLQYITLTRPDIVNVNNDQSGTTYTLVLADSGKTIRTTHNSGSVTITVPLNSSVSYPVGTEIYVTQLGTSTVTIAATGGVTLNTLTGKTLVLAERYATVILVKTATDTWTVDGENAYSVAVGDVTGPGSATDNAIAVYDGTTGKTIKNSLATVSTSGVLTLSPSSATAPIILSSNGQGQLVTGLNSDQVDGYHGTYFLNASNLETGTLPAARFNDTAHGNRSGGSLHSVATGATAGFMSAADKAKMDAIVLDGYALTSNLKYQTIQSNGSPLTQRGIFNFIPGTNVTLSVVDDSGNGRTNITINSTGGGGGGSQTLAQTLALGNTTDGYAIVFQGNNRNINTNNQGTLNTAGDSLSIFTGTGNGTGAGGALSFTSGQGGATGAGGALTITTGAGGATSGNGGALGIVSGNASTGTGGAINITSGTGSVASGTITISSGSTTSAVITSATNYTSATSRQVLAKGTASLEYISILSTDITNVNNDQSGTTYTTVLADSGKTVRFTNNSSTVTVTVPTNASVAYPVGTIIYMTQLGTSTVTVAGAGGVTVNTLYGKTLSFAGQYAQCMLVKTDTNEWILTGENLSGAATVTYGNATVDFGSSEFGSDLATIAVTGQTAITANSVIHLYIYGSDTTSDHNADEHIMVNQYISLVPSAIVPGTGFTINAVSSSRLTGTYKIRWSYQ